MDVKASLAHTLNGYVSRNMQINRKSLHLTEKLTSIDIFVLVKRALRPSIRTTISIYRK